MSGTSSLICRSLLAGDAGTPPTNELHDREQARSYLGDTRFGVSSTTHIKPAAIRCSSFDRNNGGAATPLRTALVAGEVARAPAIGWRAQRTEPHGARAFTLVEVLVALAIVCGAGLVLATAFANVMKDYDAVFHRVDHASDLGFVRTALFATADPAVAQSWNDLALPDARKARWRAAITPGQVADLFAVDCEVEITGTGTEANFKTTEHMMLLRPTWSQPADRETLRAATRDKLAQRQWQ
jgi:prepilin-type N-terminal cleavage/methylation domain-containing protein